jgi:hypothetical protein
MLRSDSSIGTLELHEMLIGTQEAELIASLTSLKYLSLVDCTQDEQIPGTANAQVRGGPRHFILAARQGQLPIKIAPSLEATLRHVEYVNLSGPSLNECLSAIVKSCPQASEMHLEGRWSTQCGTAIQQLDRLEDLWIRPLRPRDVDSLELRGLKPLRQLALTQIPSEYRTLTVASSRDLRYLKFTGQADGTSPRATSITLELIDMPNLCEIRLCELSIAAITVERCPAIKDVYLTKCRISSKISETLPAKIERVRIHTEHSDYLTQ